MLNRYRTLTLISRVINKELLIVCSFILFLGCQPGLVNETEVYSAEQTNKLFVVDCLLPGQIRKLGSQMTYMSSRRPIKTTAGDCEIRGGEYVAYDRANYATSLKVWLPQAKKGDADAQVMLGEIYEKGLGGLEDPVLAAQWYRKAAEQGSSRAQINLGYLYEKGLGVDKNLPEALNWYRKASGLENTDLEFASVTEASVAGSYQKKLEDLRKSSKKYQQQAEKLTQQLNRARQSYQNQQKRLSTIRKQLDQSREALNQEKNKKDVNQQLLKKLETDFKRKELSYLNQKIKLSKTQLKVEKESQASESSYSRQLKNQQSELKIQESAYQDAVIGIKSTMQLIAKKAKIAKSTQDKLEVKQLRNKLKFARTNLLSKGRQIAQLKKSITKNEKIVSNLGEKQEQITLATAGIEIIEPSMVLTRGIPSYQLRSISPRKKIVGKVTAFNDLQSLTVNGRTIMSDKKGFFEAEIEISDKLNLVEVVATYKERDPSVLSFNLLAKSSSEVSKDMNPPVRATSSTYPSIDFGRFYALIIGNQEYTQLASLKTSINDATAVDEILRNRYGYKTTLLINANRHQVMTAFNDLRKVLTEKDNLLIYYAGHGEIDKSDQSAYWLPTDAETNNSANWLSSHSITQFLNIIKARHILVVADSCYSGAMTKTSVARLPGKMAEDKRKKWLNFMVKRKARTVITSGGVKPVLDSGGGRHSVFAQAFLNVLKQNNGLMEDYELFRTVSGYVRKSASLIGFQQEPQYSAMLHTGHEGSPFFFISTVN